MNERRYRIICLKRSEANTDGEGYFRWTKPIYWRPNYAGYTDDIGQAGIYTAEEVQRAGGKRGDWVLEPIDPSFLNDNHPIPNTQRTLGDFL